MNAPLFSISHEPLNCVALENLVRDPQAGAFVSFVGWVRDHNDGRKVLALEYESYEVMANQEGERIVKQVCAEFNVLHAICAHRVGQLALGEVAVWVGVSAAHRAEAFRACQAIIDHVKHTVPIWKKEHYANGDAEWVHCHHCATAREE